MSRLKISPGADCPKELAAEALISIAIACIRCGSTRVKLLSSGARRFCLTCGFNWHRESTDELDELIRREIRMMK